MDKYIDTLESLMKVKKERKKKEPSIKEKEAFREAWVNLAVGFGFTARAEQFLYEGFAFCGAEPFYEYLVQTDEPNVTLTSMFSGKYYGTDSNVTFRIVAHLLALLLNNDAPRNLLLPVVKRLPKASYNKENKRLGTAEKTMEKYFFSELKHGVVFLPLTEIGTKPAFTKEFIEFMMSIMDGIERNGAVKGLVAENIEKVREWLAAYEPPQKTAPEVIVHEKSSSTEKEESASHAAVPATQINVPTSKSVKPSVVQNAPVIVEEKPADIIDLIGKVGKAASVLKAESIQQKAKIDALTFALDNEQKKLAHANHQIKDLSENIGTLRQKLLSAEADNVLLRQTIETQKALIAEKDAEIAERIKMAEVLSRDRNKQGNELLQRMASEIKKECLDFYEAAEMPMSCDLGEIMRDKLTAILAILEKGGMKIK